MFGIHDRLWDEKDPNYRLWLTAVLRQMEELVADERRRAL